MDKTTFLDKIKEIGTVEDETKRREILTELTDEVAPLFDHEEELTSQINKYKEDNESLRNANMKLFLKVGSDKTSDEITKDKTGVVPLEEKPKRKYEDLFDEKGMIK